MRPVKKSVPEWLEMKPEEVKELVIKLANEGNTKSEIGLILRDQYAIPSVKIVTGKTISEILREAKLEPEIPEDLLNLIKKSVRLQKHLEKNKKDFTAKRGLQLTESKIRRLVNYYTKKGKLPKDWRYSPESAKLLAK